MAGQMLPFPRGIWIPPDERQVIETEYDLHSLPITVTRVLGADPFRVAVAFSAPSGANVYIAPTPKIDNFQGFKVVDTLPPLIISDDQLPGMAAREWYAIAGTASTALAVFWSRLVG